MPDQCQNETTCTMKAATSSCSCDMPEKLLALADEAWHELLKEKIKAEISKTCADSMDKLAKLVAETDKAKWAHMIKGKVKCNEYRDKVKAIFSEDVSAD